MSKSPSPHSDRLSRATASRLSLYLRCLEAWHREGVARFSSGDLARELGITDAQVRKDLAQLGNLGQRGIGYTTIDLTVEIRRVLGIDRTWRAAMVGIGNLARALLRYDGFQAHGFEVVALYDASPDKIGEIIEGKTIYDFAMLEDQLLVQPIELAIVTVPGPAAQAVADRLVNAGVKGILNFAPVMLKLPVRVQLVTVDFTIQLEQLAFRVQTGDDDHRLSDAYPIV